MEMPSTTLLESIGDQFTGILKIIQSAVPQEKSPAPALRENSRQLAHRVFDLLSQGESLPFFRQNYMELSGYISLLADDVIDILDLRKNLPEAESKSLSPLFETIKETISIFYSALSKLERNIPESAREIKLARSPLGKAKEIVRGLKQLALSAGGHTLFTLLAELANGAVKSLETIDLALKKLIVIRTL